MKNAFYFTLKALFVLEIFQFLFSCFGHEGKQLDKKDTVNFKIHDIRKWITNNYNTDIARYFKNKSNPKMKIYLSLSSNFPT